MASSLVKIRGVKVFTQKSVLLKKKEKIIIQPKKKIGAHAIMTKSDLITEQNHKLFTS